MFAGSWPSCFHTLPSSPCLRTPPNKAVHIKGIAAKTAGGCSFAPSAGPYDANVIGGPPCDSCLEYLQYASIFLIPSSNFSS